MYSYKVGSKILSLHTNGKLSVCEFTSTGLSQPRIIQEDVVKLIGNSNQEAVITISTSGELKYYSYILSNPLDLLEIMRRQYPDTENCINSTVSFVKDSVVVVIGNRIMYVYNIANNHYTAKFGSFDAHVDVDIFAFSKNDVLAKTVDCKLYAMEFGNDVKVHELDPYVLWNKELVSIVKVGGNAKDIIERKISEIDHMFFIGTYIAIKTSTGELYLSKKYKKKWSTIYLDKMIFEGAEPKIKTVHTNDTESLLEDTEGYVWTLNHASQYPFVCRKNTQINPGYKFRTFRQNHLFTFNSIYIQSPDGDHAILPHAYFSKSKSWEKLDDGVKIKIYGLDGETVESVIANITNIGLSMQEFEEGKQNEQPQLIFITATGTVYVHDPSISDRLCVKKVEYFDENPIAKMCGNIGVKSARKI